MGGVTTVVRNFLRAAVSQGKIDEQAKMLFISSFPEKKTMNDLPLG